MTQRTLLAIVNPLANAQPAAQRAAALARTLDWALHLHASVHEPDHAQDLFHISGALEPARRSLVEETRQRLEALARSLGIADTTTSARWGHPFDQATLEAIETVGPELVVVGARNPERPSSAEWRLIHRCPVPLLFVRRPEWKEKPFIMPCLDPLHERDRPEALAQQIMRWSDELARAFEVPIHALHAVGLTPAVPGSEKTPDSYRAEIDSDRSVAIRALLPEERREQLEVLLAHTTPVESIQAFAESRDADLLILGSISRPWLKDRLIDGTLRELLPRLERDMLLVPPPAPEPEKAC